MPYFDEQTRKIIHAYAKGVNEFIATGKLPLQFKILRYKPKVWTDVDSVVWEKMMAFDLQTSMEQKIKNYLIAKKLGVDQIAVLLPPYPNSHPTILNNQELQQSGLLPAHKKARTVLTQHTIVNLHKVQQMAGSMRKELGFWDFPGKGSNNWVVSGKLTATGKPLLANDPHLKLSSPGIWYLVDLRGPHVHVMGASIPGLPCVAIGHNDYIAWGVTNVDPDTQDLYLESRGAKLTTIHEIIKVKNRHAIDWPVRVSKHGPIISDVGLAKNIGQSVALKWPALISGDTTAESFIKINYAHNWHEFVDALRYFVVPSQNFIYADQKGNIGYYLPGHIPIRKGDKWIGYIPFTELPHVYNPREGMIVSANNKVVPENYPYHLSVRWKFPGYRAQRIVDLLKQHKPLSIDNFKQIQLDTTSYLWRDLRPFLLKTEPLNRESQIALNILRNWNGDMSLQSTGATIFAFWYRELTKMPLAKLKFTDKWDEPFFIIQQLKNKGSYCRSGDSIDCSDFLSKSLQQAMQNIITKLGKNPKNWRWSKLHYADFAELGLGKVKPIGWLWNRSITTPGGYYTVDVGSYDEGSFNQMTGPSYRQIVDLGDFNNSIYIQPIGQSDNPFSKHHADLMSLWRSGKYLPMSSNKKDWGKVHKLVLYPSQF